jgi:RNA polymerase sigma-70 factor, ECF subfamily
MDADAGAGKGSSFTGATRELALVTRCLTGDQEAWESLVASYELPIRNFSYRFTHRRDVADELTQEIFLRVYLSLGSFKPESGSLRTWLFRLTHNLLVDHHRKEKRYHSTFGGDTLETLDLSDEQQLGPLRVLEQLEASGIVAKALESLSPEIRSAVILRDIEGLSYKEISDIADTPEGTIKSRVARGRLELARRIARLKSGVRIDFPCLA